MGFECPDELWLMEYHKAMGFRCLPSLRTAKSYGLLQIMGYQSYGLRQSWLYMQSCVYAVKAGPNISTEGEL